MGLPYRQPHPLLLCLGKDEGIRRRHRRLMSHSVAVRYRHKHDLTVCHEAMLGTVLDLWSTQSTTL